MHALTHALVLVLIYVCIYLCMVRGIYACDARTKADICMRTVLRFNTCLRRVWALLFGSSAFAGLNRTGKSCRLRWVNYLHPSLKRGRMTPDEERLVLELHAQWGNRWSRIARKLQGRTDNEIKNYWRTHMRKKARQEKRGGSPTPTPSSSASASTSTSSSWSNNGATSAVTGQASEDGAAEDEEASRRYAMDQLWDEIAAADAVSYGEGWSNAGACASIPSPVWEFCSDSLWRIDDEE